MVLSVVFNSLAKQVPEIGKSDHRDRKRPRVSSQF